jgi:hypothetical protein
MIARTSHTPQSAASCGVRNISGRFLRLDFAYVFTGVVNAAKVAGAFDPHGSVAKARAKKAFRRVAKARAKGSTQRIGPTLREMFMEAKVVGMAEIASINQEIGECAGSLL